MYGSYSPSNSSMLLHSHHIAFNHRKPTNTTRMWLIFVSVQQEMRFDQKQGKSLTITPKDHGDSSYFSTSLTFLRVKAPATGQSLPKRVRFPNVEKDTSPSDAHQAWRNLLLLLLPPPFMRDGSMLLFSYENETEMTCNTHWLVNLCEWFYALVFNFN